MVHLQNLKKMGKALAGGCFAVIVVVLMQDGPNLAPPRVDDGVRGAGYAFVCHEMRQDQRDLRSRDTI